MQNGPPGVGRDAFPLEALGESLALPGFQRLPTFLGLWPHPPQKSAMLGSVFPTSHHSDTDSSMSPLRLHWVHSHNLG